MMQYNHLKIEPKWQKYWEEHKMSEVQEDNAAPRDKRRYILDMFPYPSGAGLHVGHPEGYTATDIYARYLRMKGYQVLHPMGWDGFGLPAENYAIKQGAHPQESTYKNIDNFRRQIKSLGFSYDWSREIATCDPEYYKWTQRLFLLLYKNNLAFRKKAPVNWCESCQTVLAREQVQDGKCERCGSQVIQKELKQWFFKITDYAERLLSDLDQIDWPEPIKLMQRNWIGRSEGALIKFKIQNSKFKISIQNSKFLEVFTTRADTVFGATYMVIAPEHEIITNYELRITNYSEVKEYAERSKQKNELERTDLAKEKTGVEIKGIKAINPATGQAIPIWVADYVLMSYGTGAIMAVPAHDRRDFEFARKYKLSIIPVIKPPDKCQNSVLCYTGEGILINSQSKNPEKDSGNFVESANIALTDCLRQGCNRIIEDTSHSVKISFNGMSSQEAKDKIVAWLEEKGLAKKSIQYKLRDWLISRQRYWGAPIPIIYCYNCGEVQEDFLKNIEWLLKNVTKDNFETINQSKAVGHFSEEIDKVVVGQGSLVYLNSYVLGKLRGWFRKFRGHSELPFDLYFLLPRVIYAPSVVYQDNRNPSIYHFVLNLERHNFNVVIDIERIEDRNEITTLFIARDGYFKKLKIIKKESSRGTATSPSCLPDLKNRDGGSGISTLCKNSYRYYKCFGTKSQEVLYKKAVKLIPVPEDQLPVELPDDVDFRPTGESPLKRSRAFHKVKCPQCGSDQAKRESDTMDTFVCSSWYYFRYADPHNRSQFASKDKIKYWMPVDIYVGGAEHAVMHLLYARFFCKVLYDQGIIDFAEPFQKLINQGLILAQDGRKMSKSLGNVINPDDIVREYGADTLRMYEMFMGPLEDAKPWDTKGIKGVRRFLEKIWKLFQIQNSKFKIQNCNSKFKVLDQQQSDDRTIGQLLHKTVKKVTEDIENFKFNTAISQLMILVNAMQKSQGLLITDYPARHALPGEAGRQLLITLLAPFAPHLAEELWRQMGNQESVFKQKWPEYDRNLIKEKMNKIIVQVNGKVRDIIEAPIEIERDEILAQAYNSQKVQKWLDGQKVKKEIYVHSKLVNFVI